MDALLGAFTRIDNLIKKIIAPLVVVLSLFVAFAMVAGVVSRSVLNTPVLGLEELILFAVIWLYMLGAALASQERSHLRADFVSTFVHNSKVRDTVHLLATVISLIMVIAFIVWSHNLFIWGFTMQQSTPVFRIPFYLSQSSLFCASLLLLFYSLRDTVRDIHQLNSTRGSD